jgi:2-polyprenyl-3-methyl-5-hydroxy-6-metoxy-1,4-benzoquinol methylase
MPADSALTDFNREVFSDRQFEAGESRLRKALAMLAEESGRGRVLDTAAGSGIASEQLSLQGWDVSALDISESLIEQIRARGIADVHCHDLSDGTLPFEDGVFQGVFAGEIIEHLVDTRRFLNETHRVLAPGGIVVITTPNLASFENRLRLLFGRYPQWVEYELSDQGHVRSYTPKTLRAQLRDCGFAVEAIKGNWVPVVPQRYMNDLIWPAIAKTGDWLPGLSQGLIVKARRAG